MRQSRSCVVNRLIYPTLLFHNRFHQLISRKWDGYLLGTLLCWTCPACCSRDTETLVSIIPQAFGALYDKAATIPRKTDFIMLERVTVVRYH